MIRTFRHKGLKRLFEQDDPSGVNPEQVSKLRNILAMLQAAPTIAHMDLPGFRLRPLKGALKGFWAVTVRANWRVIFRFDGDAEDVDYIDYLKGKSHEQAHDHEKPASPRPGRVAGVH